MDGGVHFRNRQPLPRQYGEIIGKSCRIDSDKLCLLRHLAAPAAHHVQKRPFHISPLLWLQLRQRELKAIKEKRNAPPVLYLILFNLLQSVFNIAIWSRDSIRYKYFSTLALFYKFLAETNLVNA